MKRKPLSSLTRWGWAAGGIADNLLFGSVSALTLPVCLVGSVLLTDPPPEKPQISAPPSASGRIAKGPVRQKASASCPGSTARKRPSSSSGGVIR